MKFGIRKVIALLSERFCLAISTDMGGSTVSRSKYLKHLNRYIIHKTIISNKLNPHVKYYKLYHLRARIRSNMFNNKKRRVSVLLRSK